MLVVAAVVPASAGQHDAFLAKWYKALGDVDLTALDTLIHPEAIFTLEEFGSKQTKQELIDYLRQWDDARIKVQYKTTAEQADTVTMRVCYDFGDQKFTNREIYRVVDGRVASASQARLADDCNAF